MRFGAFLGAAAILFSAASALADDASSRAETLFREGKALMTADNFESACPKLAESQRIEPASGTLLALAICDERRGHAASSYAEFLQLVVLAEKEGHHDRLEIAKQRLAVLAPTVAHITLTTSAENLALPGLVVTIDETSLQPSQLHDAWPVDPGRHQLSIVADGNVHYAQTVDVAPAAQREIFVPELRPESSGASTQRTLGLVGIGVGAAAMLFAVLGVRVGVRTDIGMPRALFGLAFGLVAVALGTIILGGQKGGQYSGLGPALRLVHLG